MPKRPSMQWYTGDWLKDPRVRKCSPATRGMWFDMICAMWEDGQRGDLVGTVEQLARTVGVFPAEMSEALIELSETGAADVFEWDKSGTCPADVRKCPGPFRVVNRRMSREEKSRESERLRKRRQRVPKDVPEHVPKKSRPPSSTSVSTSLRSVGKKRRRLPDDFRLTDERRSKVPGGVDAEAEFAQFRNHHRAKGSLMLDWDAAWRTWCGNVKKFHGGRNGGGRSDRPSSAAARVDAANPVEPDPGKGHLF